MLRLNFSPNLMALTCARKVDIDDPILRPDEPPEKRINITRLRCGNENRCLGAFKGSLDKR
ncbi:unknown [Eggerthella sp. CAG:209]|nr:unknown [Eggerthella sp. CAG:209]